MAVTSHIYNHTTALLAGQAINLTTLRVMLLKDTAAFDATHISVDQVAGALTGDPAERLHEVYGSGWDQGGESVAAVTATTITTNDARLSGGQVSKTATGGNIGPCRYVLLYDATSMKPIQIYDLGQNEYAGDTTDFKLTFDLLGVPGTIYTLTVD
ncbi:MAG TPA: hypothetical protein VNQ56_12805 [Pseudolabrys sp.]|nr:hypothetical protein [Pseudolabrys sp.]